MAPNAPQNSAGRSPVASPDVDSDDLELTRLIAACAARNSQALRQLYDRTAPQLLACMVRILKRRALAEEALQDVFVSIWQRAGQFESRRGRHARDIGMRRPFDEGQFYSSALIRAQELEAAGEGGRRATCACPIHSAFCHELRQLFYLSLSIQLGPL